MDWVITNRATGKPLDSRCYLDERTAKQDLACLGAVFESLYMVIPVYENPFWCRVLTEGFKRGDLDGILLPQFSIDVYVPGDSKTDHVVVGFLIKGVPEAVFPFRNFCQYSRGVKQVDYGDSDTLPKTSIVYVEFDREHLEIRDIFELVDEVCRLANFKPDDLSVNFPNSNKSYPYKPETIKRYFGDRDRDKNRLSQYKANHERKKQIQKELEHELDMGAIGQRLGGTSGGHVIQPNTPTAPEGPQRFQGLATPIKTPGGKDKATTETEIPDTIEASIIADARRNRTNHQFQWKDFDSRWASRLHVTPNRISSIRKKIYDRT